MTEVTIRRAISSDSRAARELYRQLDDVHAVAEPALIRAFEDAQRPDETTLGHVPADVPPFFVAINGVDASEQTGRLIGFARLVVREPGPGFVVPAVPDLEGLVVLDGERGRGTGRRLLRAATE